MIAGNVIIELDVLTEIPQQASGHRTDLRKTPLFLNFPYVVPSLSW